MKKLLWLDDMRDPFANNGEWLVFSPIQRPYEVHWAIQSANPVGRDNINGLLNGYKRSCQG